MDTTDSCAICLEPTDAECTGSKKTVDLTCGHRFHLKCVCMICPTKPFCPICREELDLTELVTSIGKEEELRGTIEECIRQDLLNQFCYVLEKASHKSHVKRAWEALKPIVGLPVLSTKTLIGVRLDMHEQFSKVEQEVNDRDVAMRLLEQEDESRALAREHELLSRLIHEIVGSGHRRSENDDE